MNDLDRYLKTATQGLPSVEKERLTEELRGSVLERAAELQVSGMTEQQALEAALREFGDPRPLAAGMRGVHLWPKVSLFGALGMSLAAITILNWPHAFGQQVQVTTEGLIPRCTLQGPPAGATYCSADRTAWVDLESLAQQLRRQGVTVTQRAETIPVPTMWQLPGNSVQETMLKATWQEHGRQQSFELPLTDHQGEAFRASIRQRHKTERPSIMNQPSELIFQRGPSTFLEAETLSSALVSSATLPVTIENPLSAPVLQVGRVRLVLGQAEQGAQLSRELTFAVTGLLSHQYQATIYYGSHYLPTPDNLLSRPRGFTQQVRVKGRPGELYAVLFPVTAQGVNGLGFDLTTVDADGQLKFRTAQEKVAFTVNVKALADAGEKKAAVTLLRLGNPVTLQKNELLRHTLELP
ncbi:permease prefix domain 1-containing protein [Deinococcus sp. VB343]|uniref:Permease prefix domain 1-containing protein n=1 Tax=Deinococcus sp. VB142 TaxID=3112952 RepID=A0AAU6Q7N3_9DEIO